VLIRAELWSESDYQLISNSFDYEVMLEDIGNWVNLPLLETDSTNNEIIGNNTYGAMIKYWFGNSDFAVGGDTLRAGSHGYNHETWYRSNGVDYYINVIPMVRLHLKVHDQPLSIEYKNNNEIVVYPNPTKDNAYVKICEAQHTPYHLEITDIFGQVVFRDNGYIRDEIEIPVRFLSNGIYLLSITTSKRYTTVFIIE
jgi:hypothetical protein